MGCNRKQSDMTEWSMGTGAAGMTMMRHGEAEGQWAVLSAPSEAMGVSGVPSVQTFAVMLC